MMKKTLTLIIFFLFPLFVASAQTKEFKEYAQMVSTDRLKDLIISLADDRTEGRCSGTIGNMMAEHTIIESFTFNVPLEVFTNALYPFILTFSISKVPLLVNNDIPT